MDAFYIWFIINENKKLPPLEYIKHNSKFFHNSYLLSREDVNKEISRYPYPKVSKMWNTIPWWIVQLDIARLIVIYNTGGFYFDIDCKINKNFKNQIGNHKCILFTEKILPNTNNLGPREDKSPERILRIANYAFGCTSPRHPFIKDVINESIRRLTKMLNEGNNKLQDTDVLWIAGPDVITSVYHTHKNKYSDILLLDKSYATNIGFGSWRE